jgi:hypothetical protein
MHLMFTSLYCVINESMVMCWMTIVNMGMEHLAFNVNQQHI